MGQQYSHLSSEERSREAALRTASEHSADRGEDRPGQVHGEPRAEARPVVRVQRERVVPPLPAETAEDRAVDLGSVLFGAGRAEEGGPAPARIPQAAPHGLGRTGAGRAAQGVEPGTDRGRLKAQCAGDPSMRISHECLYQFEPQRALDLRQYLARGRKRRTRKRAGRSRIMRVPIRRTGKGFGHFESDTVVGAAPSRRCMNTQVERRSRRLFARLVDDKSASATAGPSTRYSRACRRPRASTARGTTARRRACTCWWTRRWACSRTSPTRTAPAARQQREQERQDRRYLPKGTSFEDLTQDELDAIVGEINDTPMKLLGYKTPNWDRYNQNKPETSRCTYKLNPGHHTHDTIPGMLR